ncbi:MAG TPA: GDSL-type esterase/lipase family protein [Negativicutes bacterium]|nr:GDSL-type esterase/lipase family protein [Negativicutes bacterium]
MRSLLRRKIFPLSFGLSFTMVVLAGGSFFPAIGAKTLPNSNLKQAVMSEQFFRQDPVSLKPMLRWAKVTGAVSYEIELFNEIPQNTGTQQSNIRPFFSTRKIYVNGFNADLSTHFEGAYFFWRVRGLDFDGNPLAAFSDAKKVYVDRKKNPLQKPIPTSIFNQSAGSTLLYPVYAWIPIAGAEKYEVEIMDDLPENPNGITPSIHRIDSAIAVGFDCYDEMPRQSARPFWWRVRGLDANGNPVGVYSDAGEFSVNPDFNFVVATFGDSITHGGGGVSHSPADWEYSYLNYLNFPTINLGRSSDTSRTMVERFDRDVLPFHPQYLLIMGGTNSLRAGVRAESVIEDLKSLKEKALANKIRPIFLTLPPINPDNIYKVFAESTVSDWQIQLQSVNDFIRTQEHIDAVGEMASADGTLPTRLGIDGIHLDIPGKQKIAATVNAYWPSIAKLK